MVCKLPYLVNAMVSRLNTIMVDLDEVGISKSINGIETEFTRWVNAFSIYSELEFAHADSYRLKVGSTSGYMADQFSFLSAQNVQTKISNEYLDKLMESVELVLEVLQQEVTKGILIPRVKGHLELKLMGLKNLMEDHTNLIFDLTHRDLDDCPVKECLTGFNSTQKNDSETDWLTSWMHENDGR